jgi:hypothetical protein
VAWCGQSKDASRDRAAAADVLRLHRVQLCERALLEVEIARGFGLGEQLRTTLGPSEQAVPPVAHLPARLAGGPSIAGDHVCLQSYGVRQSLQRNCKL